MRFSGEREIIGDLGRRAGVPLAGGNFVSSRLQQHRSAVRCRNGDKDERFLNRRPESGDEPAVTDKELVVSAAPEIRIELSAERSLYGPTRVLKRREWKARWNRTIGGGKHRWASEDRAVRIPIRPTYGDAAVPFFNRRIEAEEDARGRVRIRDRAGGPAIEPASAQQPLEASDLGGA